MEIHKEYGKTWDYEFPVFRSVFMLFGIVSALWLSSFLIVTGAALEIHTYQSEILDGLKQLYFASLP